MKFKRVLLKLSGGALAGDEGKGINFDILKRMCEEIKEIVESGIQISIVIGGGNFWRGREGEEITRATSDYMGMLATAINALAMQDVLEKIGVKARIQTSMDIEKIAEPYNQKTTIESLEQGMVVIYACGTGSPFFTTDTAAALKAIETESELVILAKNIDAVYTADPNKDVDAQRIEKISYLDIINKDLKAIDATAAALCMENHIPIMMFGIKTPKNLVKAANGEHIGTLITDNEEE